MALPTPTQDNRRDMGLQSMQAIFQAGNLSIISTANYLERSDILASLKATDYDGFVSNCTSNGGQAFAVSQQAGKKCNFSIPFIRLTAEIPIVPPRDAIKKLGPQTYMNVTTHAEWSKQNLTSTVYAPPTRTQITLASEPWQIRNSRLSQVRPSDCDQ